MKPLTITERRFREGTGEKYLMDGSVRCQAQSKRKLRRWRLGHNDYTTPNEDIWPECQCQYGAKPGMFACWLHGGDTPGQNRNRSLLESMPLDLGEKLKILLENPDYLSSREDLLILKARQWELLEELGELAGSAEAWQMVKKASEALNRGEIVTAGAMLDDALENEQNHKAIWDEFRLTEALVKDLRNTEVKVAKELKLMASADQVTALLNNIHTILMVGTEKFIDDPRKQSDFLRFITGEIGRLVNLSPVAINAQLGAGGRQEN